MTRLVYLVPLLLYVLAYAALAWGGAWAWLLPVVIWGVLPLADQLHPGTTRNLDAAEEATAEADPFYTAVLYASLPLQLGVLLAFFLQLSQGVTPGLELLGQLVTVGTLCGSGINVAHELGHRREVASQRVAKALLTASLYSHFFVEHNRGHHRRVATPDDPASSRRGQSLYAFWARTVPGGWRSAWHLENARMAREGLPWWSWRSEMVRLTTFQALAVLAVGLAFGPAALAGWAVVGGMGALLLEAVNYVEHYGLTRQRTARGTWERVRPHHSWNSNRPFGRLLLFDLTRHSDHHAHATRPYQVLRHFDDAPQLPFGYTGGILLAFVPPLFHRIMGRALDDWEAQQGVRAAA